MDCGGNMDLTEELWDAWQLSPRALVWLLRYHSCSEQSTVPCTAHWPQAFLCTDAHSGGPQMSVGSDGPCLQTGFVLSMLEARAMQFSLTL